MRDHHGHPLSRREMIVRRLICALVGHRLVRAFGEFDDAQCRRCWATIATPDIHPR